MTRARDKRQAPAAKNETTPKSVTQPYPGLNFYDRHQSAFFAGRRDQVVACTDAILSSKVLILHGRSGCGKSSFLRAGVKPYLDAAGLRISFKDHPDGFDPIRSTHRPLFALAKKLHEIAQDLAGPEKGKAGVHRYGRVRDGVKRSEFLDPWRDNPSAPGLNATEVQSADAVLEALDHVLERLSTAPIFVIDQAEEVFTLLEKDRVRQSSAIDGKAASPESDEKSDEVSDDLTIEQIDREMGEYFEFLNRVASESRDCRVVVSLRTEYKGQFDDLIAAKGDHPGDSLRGYYLPELDATALKAAIVRPTLNEQQWSRLFNEGEVLEETFPARDFAPFSFEAGVAEELAGKLLTEKVPAGGVLPTLQVTCWRLYDFASRSGAEEGAKASNIKIRKSHLQLLGRIEDQVEEFMSTHVEEACRRAGWESRSSSAVEAIQRTLKKELVDVQADGRAVTKSVSREHLKERLTRALNDKDEANAPGDDVGKRDVDDTINRLEADVLSYLEQPDVSILRPDARQGRITLGHDSVALTLNRLSIVLDRESSGMARMSGMMDPLTFKREQLFDHNETPHATTVWLHQDYAWDRQTAHFALRQKLAARLGINFKLKDEWDVVGNQKGASPNWPDLCAKIGARAAKLAEEEDDVRDAGSATVSDRIMVAAEWAAFPGFRDDRHRLNKTDIHPKGWTDVLVTDVFIGNALIGANPVLAGKLKAASGNSSDFRKALKEVFEELGDSDAEIRCYDTSGANFLRLAASLCGYTEYQSKLEDRIEVIVGSNYAKADPLTSWLRDGALKDVGANRYIIGSAFARTMTQQAGFDVLISAGDVFNLARDLMSRRQQGTKEEPHEKEIKDVSGEVQKILAPTLWQVNVPAAAWKSGRERAFILRLASIGYYTVEIIRSRPDEFVRHLHDFNNRGLSAKAETSSSSATKGSRLNRWLIRGTVKDCYHWLRFEDYGIDVYDLDGITAYWSDHVKWGDGAYSAAGEIYNELMSLRQRTVDHFDRVSRTIAWLKYRGLYDPLNRDISDAYRYKEFAWNNFRIFNFYDAERYMAKSAGKFQEVLEKMSTEKPGQAVSAE